MKAEMHRLPFAAKVVNITGAEPVMLNELDAEGCLGRLQPGKIKLEVMIHAGSDIIGVHVDGAHKLTQKTAQAGAKGDQKKYTMVVPVRMDNAKRNAIPMRPNWLLLVEFFAKKLGQMESPCVRIWEVGLISWQGRFFLKKAIIYRDVFFFRDGETVACPFFEDDPRREWPEMAILLQDQILSRGLFEKLPPISAYHPDREALGLKPGEGIVSFFSWGRMFGIVSVPNESLLVRPDQLPRRDGYFVPHLRIGEVVCYKSFEKLNHRYGKDDVLRWEAVGVTPFAP